MGRATTILIIGTADTKADELQFLARCIAEAGGQSRIMDVGVLGRPTFTPDYTNEAVAAAAGSSLAAVAALGDENEAMKVMAAGAVTLATQAYARQELDGVLALGGTMGTDLALDVTAALPLGFPKFIISTVAYSHLVPAERLAPDLMMILWAGGLYGLNSVCRSILSQAAGAVLGASGGSSRLLPGRPRVAVTSLGKSCLSYMVELCPALEERGYEPVVFHCTGMGGRAMETLVDQGEFVAVFDFSLAEVSNYLRGSVVHAGPTRLEAAGRRGVPQIVAPGASDMIDVQSWLPLAPEYQGRPYHAHNRLLGSVNSTHAERCELARHVASKLNAAKGPTAFLLPRRGLHAWDGEGGPMHDPKGHEAYCAAYVAALKPPVRLFDLDLHINDPEFTAFALSIFDDWVADGLIPKAERPA